MLKLRRRLKELDTYVNFYNFQHLFQKFKRIEVEA